MIIYDRAFTDEELAEEQARRSSPEWRSYMNQIAASETPSEYSIGDVEAEIKFCQRYINKAYISDWFPLPVKPTWWQRFKWWIRGL